MDDDVPDPAAAVQMDGDVPPDPAAAVQMDVDVPDPDAAVRIDGDVPDPSATIKSVDACAYIAARTLGLAGQEKSRDSVRDVSTGVMRNALTLLLVCT